MCNSIRQYNHIYFSIYKFTIYKLTFFLAIKRRDNHLNKSVTTLICYNFKMKLLAFYVSETPLIYDEWIGKAYSSVIA